MSGSEKSSREAAFFFGVLSAFFIEWGTGIELHYCSNGTIIKVSLGQALANNMPPARCI